jgi:uridine kinase
MNPPLQVALVGGSATGKGTLAAALAQRLRVPVAHVELDAFYRDLSRLAPARRAAFDFDHPRAIDWPRVRAAFDRLAAGRPAAVPVYDFARHARRREVRVVPPAPVVLWDGLWLLDWSWMRRRFAWSIYLECEPARCLARRLARDVRERGRTPESVRRQYRAQVWPQQRRWVEPQRWWADEVVRSPWSASTLDHLAARLAARLAEARHGRSAHAS